MGASLSLVGALALMMGLTQLGLAVVIGSISDRRGRRGVLIAGMASLAVAGVLTAVSSRPESLVPIQILVGIGLVTTISISTAYVADVVPAGQRSVAIGLTTTMMGLGFAVGSWLGGTSAETWGFPTAFLLAVAMAVVGGGVAWFGIPKRRIRDGVQLERARRNRQVFHQFAMFLKNPMVLAISFGALLIFVVFGGLVILFFPIYAYGLGISPAMIGVMLATRALASTLARLPGGALATKIPGHWLLVTAILLAMMFALLLPQTQRPLFLMLLLVAEGIGYGLYFTIGQTMLTSYAGVASLGAAMGTFSMMTGIGGSLLPFFLGIAADGFGLASIYYLTGLLLIVGVILLIAVARSVD
jgi:MFS family permease